MLYIESMGILLGMKENWKDKLNADPVPWLLESNPWTKYKTISDIVETSESDGEAEVAAEAAEAAGGADAAAAKTEVLEHELVKQLVQDVENWFDIAYTRHNDPKMPHYKLRVLADFGFTVDMLPGSLLQKTTEHIEHGLPAIRQELPRKGSGFSKPNPESDEWHALPCDSPLLTATLIRMGSRDELLHSATEKILTKWSSPGGWFCDFFFVKSMYDKLNIGCPMAGLQTLELCALFPEYSESEYAKNAFAPIRFHGEYGKSLYYFGRSKKFWSLKYPFVWYNALYVASVLSQFDFIKQEPVMLELIDWIEKSQDENGRFTPSSMFRVYKGWDFADKKAPSPWITYLCCKVLKQYYEGS